MTSPPPNQRACRHQKASESVSETQPQWSQEWPTEPGTYIYTGWTMQRFSPPHFVTVGRAQQTGRVYYVLNKYLFNEKDAHDGWWLRVPDLPAAAVTCPLEAERLREAAGGETFIEQAVVRTETRITASVYRREFGSPPYAAYLRVSEIASDVSAERWIYADSLPDIRAACSNHAGLLLAALGLERPVGDK